MIYLHYTIRPHPTHPFTACIVSPDHVGPEANFRDENQMLCYCLGFLNGRDTFTQANIDLVPVAELPSHWDRQYFVYGA